MVQHLLRKVKQDHHRYEKLIKRKQVLKTELKWQINRTEDLQKQLLKEIKDVEKLEGISISGFLLMIAGKKGERLELEREEAVKARILYEEAKHKQEDTEREIYLLEEELNHLKDASVRYYSILKEVKDQIISQKSQSSETLLNIEEQLSHYDFLIKETKEAVYAASDAKKSLSAALSKLEDAKTLGYFDMAGGDLLSTYMKRSHMDESKDLLHSAQHSLKKLEKELDDIGGNLTVHIDMSDWLSIADYFFDNIFTDWAVQGKINQTIVQSQRALLKLNELMDDLEVEQTRIFKEREQLEKEKILHIEQSI